MAELRTFEESFADLYRSAYRAGYRMTGDAQASEDVASEALARAALRWRQIRGHARPWVVRVSTNLAIDHLRRQSRMVDRGMASVPEGHSDAVHRDVDLHRALELLPGRQREVVVLRYYGDLSEREIAATLGIAEGTVKSHASRGLATLRRLLEVEPDRTLLRTGEFT